MPIAQTLAGAIRAAVAGRKAETPEDEEKPEAETEEEETSVEAEEGEEDGDEGDAGVEGEPGVEGEEDEEEGEGDEDTKPEARARAAGHAAGRKAERRRIAAILASPAAEANPALAAHLAFNTSDPSQKALAALKAAGGAGSGLGQRMAGRHSQTGRGGQPSASRTTSSWDRAMKSAGVKTRT